MTPSKCCTSFAALNDTYYVSFHVQVSHPGLQRFSGQSLLTQHHSSGHPLPPKPAFWNPLHKNNSPPWQPETSDRRNPPSQEFQVRMVRTFLYEGVGGETGAWDSYSKIDFSQLRAIFMAATWTSNYWFQKKNKISKGCFVFSEAKTHMCLFCRNRT